MSEINPPHEDAPIDPDGSAAPPEAAPLSREETTMGMLCHLLALCGYVIPFGNIIGPLVIWLVKKDESPFVDDQGKESLNFQITVLLACIICLLLTFICIGVPLLILVAVGQLVLVIIASVNAAGGTAYRYPMTLRLIK